MSSENTAPTTAALAESDATKMIAGLVGDLTFARERAARAEASYGDLEREFEVVRRQRQALMAELQKIKQTIVERTEAEPVDLTSKMQAAQAKRRSKPKRSKPIPPDIARDVAAEETPNPA